MSFLSGGQLSTDKLVVQFVYIFTVSFWAGIKINSNPNRNDKSNIQSAMMDGDIYTITDYVIKFALTNNSIWIAVTNDVIIYAITNDVIEYAITNNVLNMQSQIMWYNMQ